MLDNIVLTCLSLGAVVSTVQEPPNAVIHSFPAHIVSPKTSRHTSFKHLKHTYSACTEMMCITDLLMSGALLAALHTKCWRKESCR